MLVEVFGLTGVNADGGVAESSLSFCQYHRLINDWSKTYDSLWRFALRA